MNRAQRIVLATALLLILDGIGHAADKTVYQTGKLIDMRSKAGAFCLAIQLDDMSYVVEAPWDSTDLVVGDPIKFRIKLGKRGRFWDTDTRMYLKMGKTSFDDEKVRLVRSERITPDKKAATCALPVAVDH
jgi:hypothetical protein